MSGSEGSVVLIGHLPGVVLGCDTVPILRAQTELQTLSFATYNGLTRGAHDRDCEYAAGSVTAVIAQRDVALQPHPPDSDRRLWQQKAPSDSHAFLQAGPGYDAQVWALDTIMTIWACLSLAMPQSGFITPRHSAFFLHPPADAGFGHGDRVLDGIQVQGDADHELFFAKEFDAPPLSADDVAFADSMKHHFAAFANAPELRAALQSLLAAQDPSLGRVEQAILCTIALEDLLLRGQKGGLRKGFAGCAAALVPVPMQTMIDEKDLRGVYDLRSDFLHGRMSSLGDVSSAALALPPALLSSAIRSLAPAVIAGEPLADILEQGPERLAQIADQTPWQDFAALRVDNRIAGHRKSAVTRVGTTMAASNDATLVWAPYLGLTLTDGPGPIGAARETALLPLSVAELGEMEDADILRDFFRNTQMQAALGVTPDTAGVVQMVLKQDGPPDLDRARPIDDPSTRALTIALRAVGCHTFIDPMLLGDFRYHGALRLRRPTVFRQTLLMQRFSSHDHLDQAGLSHASALHDTVLRIAADHPELDLMLTLARESFFHPVVAPAVRARLCFAFVDSIVGRVSGPDVAAQVRELAQAIAPGLTGDWFAGNAHPLRNRLAHQGDDAVAPDDLSHLTVFTGHLLHALLTYVGTAGDYASAKGFQSELRERSR